MSNAPWQIVKGDGPLIATAVHNGHDIRPDAEKDLALPKEDRLREEDPYTGSWTAVADTQVVALRSRFQVDLNRPREKAVYRKPEDAWGLKVWKQEPSQSMVEDSLAEYDAFYSEVHGIFTAAEQRHGRFVVFDLHTYNHRRSGPDGAADDPDLNPEVNLGTGTMDRDRWAPLVDRFLRDLRAFDFGGRRLDVRENVRFRGGNLADWTHTNFPQSGCVLAIEFKKFFMNEWTGELDSEQHGRIQAALHSTVSGVLDELSRLRSAR